MGTLGTKRLSTATVLSSQVKAYKRSDADGFVVSGSGISTSTSLSLSIPQAGAAASITAVNGPVITGLVYLDQNNLPSSSSAVSTLGGNIQINGSNFSATDQIYLNNVPISQVYGNSTTIYGTIPAGSTGNLVIGIFSTANIGSQANNRVRYSSAPTWVTTAALSFYNNVAANIQLQSSSDSTVTYTIKAGSGSLPTGLSLLSSGYITGTPTGYSSTTVVSPIILATDAEGQAVQQGFNITVLIGEDYFRNTTMLLSGDSSTFIADASTNNFLISRFGDTRPSRLSPYWPGGWSAYVDGSGDFITTTSAVCAPGTRDFTWETWVYTTAVYGNSTYFLIVDTGTTGLYIGYDTAGTLVVGQRSVAANNSVAYALPTYVWTHLAVARSGTTLRIFANGQQILSGSNSINYSGTGTIYVLGGLAGSNAAPAGYYSNFRFTTGAALYTANFTPSTTTLSSTTNTSLLLFREATLWDSSPSLATLVRNGDTQMSTFSPFNNNPQTIVPRSFSAFLDGTGDWLAVANTPANFGSNDFTVEFWAFFTTNTAGLQPLVSNSDVADGRGWMIIVDTDNTVSAYISTQQSSWTNIIKSSYTPLLRQWVHIALVRTTNQIVLYVDGVSVGLSYILSGFIQPAATGNFNVGYYAYFAGGARAFNGSISNLRLVNGTGLYTSNFVVPTTPLTAVSGTTLLMCHSSTFVDGSSNNYAITINGDARPRAVSPFGDTVTAISNYSWSAAQYGSSGYFDGTGDYLSIAANSAFSFGTSDYTIEFWLYLLGTGDFTIFDNQGSGGNMQISRISGVLYHGSGSTWSYTFTNNSWTHIAFSRSGTNLRLFANGQLIQTQTNSNVVGSAANTNTIGQRNDGFYSLNGYLSNLRIVKGTALYTTAFLPPASPLTTVANTSVLTLQNDIGSSSVQFVDQSPFNTLITRNADATQGSFSPLVPASWSAYFDGTGDYITVPANAAFAFGTGDFTVEAWVYQTVRNTEAQIAGPHLYGVSADWLLTIRSAGNLYFQISSSTTGAQTSTSTVPLNTWTHVAVVRSGGNVTFYINGVAAGTGSYTTSITNASTALAIGAASNGNAASTLTGYISNLRILKGTAIYTANFTPATTSLTSFQANVSLLTLNGSVLQDSGPYKLAITRNGDVRTTAFGPHAPHTVTSLGYSTLFDGTGDYLTVAGSFAWPAIVSGDYTVECWINLMSLSPSSQVIVSSSTSTEFGFRYGTALNGSPGLSIFRVGGADQDNCSFTFAANRWYHVAVTRQSGTIRFFVDGSQQTTLGSGGGTTQYAGSNGVQVGRNSSSGSEVFNGYISNLRIVPFTALYTANFTVPVQQLTAITGTSLLTCHATTLVDGSTNAQTVAAVGDARPADINPFGFTTTIGVTYSPAIHGGSMYLDGSGDYLSLPNLPAYRLAANNFTIECWFYEIAVAVANTPTICQINGDGSAWAAVRLGLSETGRTINLLMTTNGSSWQVSVNSTATYNRGTWNHIAVVRNGTAVTVYLNGAVVISTTISGSLYAGTLNWIGNLSFSSGTWFVQGYISGFRILNGTALYTTPFVLPQTAVTTPTANTAFQCNFTNSAVIDAAYRSVLTTVGDARVANNLFRYGTGSLYFDGTGDYLYNPGPTSEYIFGTGDFTIEFWMYTSNAAQTALLYDPRPTSVNGAYSSIYMQSSTLKYYANTADQITGGALTNNTWMHVAVARSGTATKMFLNGTQVGSTYTDSTNYTCGANRPFIGISGFDGLVPYLGYIDDLRVTKGYARYTANFTTPITSFPAL